MYDYVVRNGQYKYPAKFTWEEWECEGRVYRIRHESQECYLVGEGD